MGLRECHAMQVKSPFWFKPTALELLKRLPAHMHRSAREALGKIRREIMGDFLLCL